MKSFNVFMPLLRGFDRLNYILGNSWNNDTIQVSNTKKFLAKKKRSKHK